MTQLVAKPILCCGPMVNALLDGRKTQTRRVVKNVQQDNTLVLRRPTKDKAGLCTHVIDAPLHPELLPISVAKGDLLWVRETWHADKQMDHVKPSELFWLEPTLYSADMTLREPSCPMIARGKKRPGIFMPKAFSRLTLRVTDVRVERLQEISEADAIAEGIDRTENTFGNGPTYCDYSMGEDSDPAEWFSDPVNSFKSLWNGISSKRGFGWNQNPWVAAYTFEVLHQNVNEVAA